MSRNQRFRTTTIIVVTTLLDAEEIGREDLAVLCFARWNVEWPFKERKSTLGVGQYPFDRFEAVEARMNTAIATVLFLEQERAKQLSDRLKNSGGIKK